MRSSVELTEDDFLPRISQEYEDAENLWGVDYWSVWEDVYQEDLKYERQD